MVDCIRNRNKRMHSTCENLSYKVSVPCTTKVNGRVFNDLTKHWVRFYSEIHEEALSVFQASCIYPLSYTTHFFGTGHLSSTPWLLLITISCTALSLLPPIIPLPDSFLSRLPDRLLAGPGFWSIHHCNSTLISAFVSLVIWINSL